MSVREYLELVEQIQQVLASPVDPEPEVVEQLHRRYCEAVEEVNRRLRRCEELLQDGHRSEAIQECERRPNLLKSVAALDFPEAMVWSDYATQFGLLPAPELLVEVAADLNDAYSVDSSLEELMVRYRLLNLARSPLKARLSVLQRIAAADRSNTAWLEDLEQFEKARLQELQKELTAAIQEHDFVALSRLHRELTSQPWQSPPPRQLMQRMEAAYRQEQVAHARRKLQQVTEKLNEAFRAQDEEAGRTLRRQWKSLAEIAEVQPDDPLWEEAAPALQWLEEQDQQEQRYQEHLQGVAQLELLLDQGVQDAQALEKAVYQATKDGFDLPDHLATRVESRLAAIQLGARRRVQAIVVAVSLGVVLLAGGIGYAVHRQVVARKIQQQTELVRQFLDQDQLLTAQRHLQRLEKEDPGVFQHPAVQALAAEVGRRLEKDAQRAAELKQLLDGVQRIVQDEADWNAVLQAQKDLRKAKALCKSAEETSRVLKLQQQVQAKEQQLRKEVDERFLQDLAELVEREKRLNRTDLQGITTLLEEARTLKRRPHVSLELTQSGSELHRLIQRLQDRLQTAEQWQRRQQVFAEITQSVGNVAAFLASLRSYARQFPDDARSKTMVQLADQQAECWKALPLWNDVVAAWEGVDVTRLTVAAAKNRLQQLERLQQESERFPVFQELYRKLAPRVEYLESIVARYDENDQLLTQRLIQVWFNRPTVRDMLMIETKDGLRYYTDRRPKLNPDSVVIRYWQTPTGLTVRTKTISLEQIANPRNGTTFLWESPQSQFATKALGILAKAGPGQWEMAFLELAKQLHKTKIDPVLKVFLLKAIMETGARGSAVLRQAWKSSLAMIEAAELDPTVNWIDPRDEEAAKTRRVAERLLQRLRPWEEVTREVQQHLEMLRREVKLERIEWVGWLYSDADGKWQCGLKNSYGPLHGSLMVLVGQRLARPSSWSVIATIDGEGIQWKLQAKGSLMNGMPVFFSKQPPVP